MVSKEGDKIFDYTEDILTVSRIKFPGDGVLYLEVTNLGPIENYLESGQFISCGKMIDPATNTIKVITDGIIVPM